MMSTALAVTPTTPSISLGTLQAATPAALVEGASEMAKVLAGVIKTQGLSSRIQGREYVQVEGWTTLTAMLGITAQEVSTTEQDGIYTATMRLVRMSDGATVGQASAECGAPDEFDRQGKPLWAGRARYARRSMAQTRAVGKACRLSFSWIMRLAGYEATPAEEMPDLIDPGESAAPGRTGSRVSQRTPPQWQPPATITAEQHADLLGRIATLGLDADKVASWVGTATRGKVTALEQMSDAHLADLLPRLEGWAQPPAGEATQPPAEATSAPQEPPQTPADPDPRPHTASSPATDQTPPPGPYISDGQHRRLEARIHEMGLKRERVKDWIARAWKVQHLNELPESLAGKLDAKLEEWAEQSRLRAEREAADGAQQAAAQPEPSAAVLDLRRQAAAAAAEVERNSNPPARADADRRAAELNARAASRYAQEVAAASPAATSYDDRARRLEQAAAERVPGADDDAGEGEAMTGEVLPPAPAPGSTRGKGRGKAPAHDPETGEWLDAAGV